VKKRGAVTGEKTRVGGGGDHPGKRKTETNYRGEDLKKGNRRVGNGNSAKFVVLQKVLKGGGGEKNPKKRGSTTAKKKLWA